jgi:hypothetical protein
MREFLDLANNPLFVKHLRSRLRRSAILPGLVVIGFLCLCIIWANSQAKGPNNPQPTLGSQMFFWLQSIILVLIGGTQVASAVAQIKESGIIDFHRITPIPSSVQTIGIMLGAPIRELLLYAVTLPFALYMAIDGPIGATNFAKLVLVQLGGAMMYYSFSMIVGLAGSGKARGASGRFVAILGIFNLAANFFFAAGIYGPTLITSIPVYHEVFMADEDAQRAAQRQANMQQQQGGNQGQFNPQQKGGNQGQFNPQQKGGNQGQFNPQQQQGQQQPPPLRKREVTFFGAPVPLVVQSLMFQISLLTFLFIGASRRIHSARQPLYTKPIALLFFSTISVLTLGSLWDSATLFLTLGSVYFLVVFSIMLTNSVTPPLGEVVKGMQRARKLSGMRVPLWSDLASNKFIVLLYGCILAATVSIGLGLAPQPPIAGILDLRHVFSPWPPLLVGVLTVLTYGFASQYFAIAFGNRARSFFALFLFAAWIVPIIVGIIATLASDEFGYILGISPIIGISFAGMFGVPRLDEVTVKVVCVAPGAICAVLFFFLVLNEERKLHSEVIDEHSRRRRKRSEDVEEFEEHSPKRRARSDDVDDHQEYVKE